MATQDLKPIQSGIPSDWLLNALVKKGIPLSTIAKALKLESEILGGGRCVLPLSTFNRIFEWAADYLDLPDLALMLSTNIDPTEFGLMGYLTSHSATLGDWLELFERYHCIFTPEYDYSASINERTCRLYYYAATLEGCETRQDIDFSMGTLTRPMRQFVDPSWTPDKASFTYSKPKDIRRLKSIFGPNLNFNQAHNFIEFPVSVLSTQNTFADPKLFEILKVQANHLLDQMHQEQSIVDKVKLLITTNIGNDALSTESIAVQLHMSVRNLYRQLKEQGTSFQELRDEALLKLAKELLAESDASVTDISLKLGYSEASSFVRVFKRLEGMTPLQFRKMSEN